MKKRTTREVFPQVASMQQFFNYGHPTPQVPFTMQVGGSMTSGMSNMAMQTGQLPMMDMGSSFIDRQVSDAARMGYMAEGGVTNNHVAPNFYINKLDKFMGKVKGMAARANEKRLMEDALSMAQEKGMLQEGGPSTASNSEMFKGMDFSKASTFLNAYNDIYSKSNANKLNTLANNMRMTAMANSTPYAKKIHTYDLENPYWNEDSQPINMPDPYKAMLPKDLGLAKYGLQTFQSDVNTGEKQEETKPLTNEELLAKINEQNKRIEALEGKKSKCASGNCTAEEEQEIIDEEQAITNNESNLKNMQARLSVMDIKDKYRWNAASRFGNLLAGSSDPGRPGQLRERTYHYEFGKKGQMPPEMMSGMASMPDGAASIIVDNSDVWKKWQNAPGVGGNKKTTETKPVNPRDPYNIYPDEWEGLVLGNKDKMPSSPVKPGFLPRVVPPTRVTTQNPTGGISTPQNPFGTPMNLVSSIIPRTTEQLKAEVEALKQQQIDSEWIDNPTPIPARINTANPSNRIVTFSDVYDGTPVNLSPDDMPYGPIRQQGMSPMVETYKRGGLTKFMKKYQGDQGPSETGDDIAPYNHYWDNSRNEWVPFKEGTPSIDTILQDPSMKKHLDRLNYQRNVDQYREWRNQQVRDFINKNYKGPDDRTSPEYKEFIKSPEYKNFDLSLPHPDRDHTDEGFTIPAEYPMQQFFPDSGKWDKNSINDYYQLFKPASTFEEDKARMMNFFKEHPEELEKYKIIKQEYDVYPEPGGGSKRIPKQPALQNPSFKQRRELKDYYDKNFPGKGGAPSPNDIYEQRYEEWCPCGKQKKVNIVNGEPIVQSVCVPCENEKAKRGGLIKFIKKYQGDNGSSQVFDPGMWEIDTGEDTGNSEGLGYQQGATAMDTMPMSKAEPSAENNWINTGQDITMGQNFGMGIYAAPIMEMVANRRDAAKQDKGDVINKFNYADVVNPVTGNKGVYDQFGNQFPDKRNFNMYYGKSGGEMYEEGGVYFLDEATIKQLKAGGAIIEYID